MVTIAFGVIDWMVECSLAKVRHSTPDAFNRKCREILLQELFYGILITHAFAASHIIFLYMSKGVPPTEAFDPVCKGIVYGVVGKIQFFPGKYLTASKRIFSIYFIPRIYCPISSTPEIIQTD
jgi:hypothetical protein